MVDVSWQLGRGWESIRTRSKSSEMKMTLRTLLRVAASTGGAIVRMGSRASKEKRKKRRRGNWVKRKTRSKEYRPMFVEDEEDEEDEDVGIK